MDCHLFKNFDACLEPVMSLAEALADPQVQDRRMIVELPLPGGGTVEQLAFPIQFSTTRPEYGGIGVLAGTHTSEVLIKLGYTEDEIGAFEKTGLFQ